MLRMFENKELRKIIGAKRDEITREPRECIMLSYMHCILRLIRTPKSRRLRWAEHAACMELSRNAYRILVCKREGNLGRPRGWWEDNIKID